jgi:hypothetical protein
MVLEGKEKLKAALTRRTPKERIRARKCKTLKFLYVQVGHRSMSAAS